MAQSLVFSAVPDNEVVQATLGAGDHGSNLVPAVLADAWNLNTTDNIPIPTGPRRNEFRQIGGNIGTLARNFVLNLTDFPANRASDITAITATLDFTSLSTDPGHLISLGGAVYYQIGSGSPLPGQSSDVGPVNNGVTIGWGHSERVHLRPMEAFAPSAGGFPGSGVSATVSGSIGSSNCPQFHTAIIAALGGVMPAFQVGLGLSVAGDGSVGFGGNSPSFPTTVSGKISRITIEIFYSGDVITTGGGGGGGGGGPGGPGDDGGASANATEPFNFQDRYGRLHRTAISGGDVPGNVLYWRSDFAVPRPWELLAVSVTSPPGGITDSNPRVIHDAADDLLYILFSRHDTTGDTPTDTVYLTYSSDDGKTWSDLKDMNIPGGIHTTIGRDDMGTKVFAAYVANADQSANPGGIIQARIQEAGDTGPSDIYTFLDSSGNALNAADDTFHLSRGQEPSDRWVLTVNIQGTGCTEWTGADAKTWEIVS